MPCLGKAKQIFHPKTKQGTYFKTHFTTRSSPTHRHNDNKPDSIRAVVFSNLTQNIAIIQFMAVHRNRRHINSLAQIFNSHFHSWQFCFFPLGNRRPSPSIIVTLKIQPPPRGMQIFKGRPPRHKSLSEMVVPPPATVRK